MDTVQVTIVCFGAMREYLPSGTKGNTVTIDLGREATVSDAVAALGAPVALVHAALVNENPGDLSSPLEQGDRLTLMPHYSGGRT